MEIYLKKRENMTNKNFTYVSTKKGGAKGGNLALLGYQKSKFNLTP